MEIIIETLSIVEPIAPGIKIFLEFSTAFITPLRAQIGKHIHIAIRGKICTS